MVDAFMPRITIAEFEKYHAKALRRPTPRASLREALVALVVSIVMK